MGVCIGIDVSKSSLDLAGHGVDLAVSHVGNDDAGYQQVIEALRRVEVQVVVLESTGGLERGIATALMTSGFPVAVVNPRQVHHFAKVLGQFAKTDEIDAMVLAHFGEVVKLRPQTLPSAQSCLISALVARRRQLVEMRSAEKNRRSFLRLASPRVRASLDNSIRFLDREIAKIDHDLDEAIQASPAWRERDNLLQQVPGVGPVVSRSLIANLPELGTLSRRQIAALAGLAPFPRDSGASRGKRSIFAGRADVRSILYMAALVASKYNPLIKPLYQRLLLAGKAPKLVLVACARKLLTILNAIARDRSPWNSSLLPLPS